MVNGLESSGKMKEYIAIIARYTISFVTVITILNCANFLISFLLLTLTVMKYTMILTIAKNNICKAQNGVTYRGIICLNKNVKTIVSTTTHDRKTKNLLWSEFIIFCFLLLELRFCPFRIYR
mgnify:FL=1